MNELRELERRYKEGLITKEGYIRLMHEQHQRLWDYAAFIKDRNVSCINIMSSEILLTTKDDVTLLCDSSDRRIAPIELLNFGDYEPVETKMMLGFVDEHSIIVDIGANIGWYSIVLARKARQGRVFAFEPMPTTFTYLQKNLLLNRTNNVETFNYGLSDKKETIEFFFDPNLSAATSARNIYEDPTKHRVSANVCRMDDVLADLERIDLIKCDVEGAEIFVLYGGIETLRRTKPILFLEMLRKWTAKFAYHPNKIIELLSNLGYHCYCVEDSKLLEITRVDEETIQTNFFFLDPIKHRHRLDLFV